VDIGANAGSPMNSTGNVHVGMVRNANVSVEETVNSWAVSSHRVLAHGELYHLKFPFHQTNV